MLLWEFSSCFYLIYIINIKYKNLKRDSFKKKSKTTVVHRHTSEILQVQFQTKAVKRIPSEVNHENFLVGGSDGKKSFCSEGDLGSVPG